MDDFVAHNSRWRGALHLFGAVGFVVVGMLMVGAFGEVPGSRRYSAGFATAIGWICIIFFGMCGLVIIKKLLDADAQLQIGPSGLRWRPWSDKLIPWSEIIDVTTWGHMGQPFIVLHLNNADRFPGRGLAATLAGANRMLAGGDISISLTGTDRSHGDALKAIAHFRSAAASSYH